MTGMFDTRSPIIRALEEANKELLRGLKGFGQYVKNRQQEIDSKLEKIELKRKQIQEIENLKNGITNNSYQAAVWKEKVLTEPTIEDSIDFFTGKTMRNGKKVEGNFGGSKRNLDEAIQVDFKRRKEEYKTNLWHFDKTISECLSDIAAAERRIKECERCVDTKEIDKLLKETQEYIKQYKKIINIRGDKDAE